MGRRSRCERKAGAVIVSQQQRVISTGYAGPPAGFTGGSLYRPMDESTPCSVYCPRANTIETGRDPGYNDCVSSHAEANAIIMADRSLIDGGAFYVSTVPCYGCTKMIANTGVVMVVFIDDGRGDLKKISGFLKQCNIVPDPRSGAVRPENTKKKNSQSAWD